MRTALVVHDCNSRGGHERYSLEILQRVARVHETHLFACTEDVPNAPPHTFHRVPAVRRPHLLKALLFLMQTGMLRRAGPFDIVHSLGLCFGQADLVSAVVCQAARLQATGNAWTGPRGAYFRMLLRITALLERRLIYDRPETTVIAISDNLRKELVHHYACPPNRIHVIYLGVDSARFSPDPIQRADTRRELGLEDRDLGLLYVGPPEKGLDTVLDALRPIAEEKRIKLLVAGSGDPTLYAPLMTPERAGDWARYLGRRPDLVPIYQASDMFVFASRCDAFGLAVLEAMACGLPLLVSHCVGASEIVRDGLDGIHLRDPRDAEEVRAGVLRLADDRGLRSSLGTQARSAALRYTWDETARQTLELYEMVALQPSRDKQATD